VPPGVGTTLNKSSGAIIVNPPREKGDLQLQQLNLRPGKGEYVALTFWNILSERDVDPPIRTQNLPYPFEAKQLIARKSLVSVYFTSFSMGGCDSSK
jgi:hypothetical protein